MNVKIITCHDVYNYGASLQAYALQTYLRQKAHQVEIIDYRPPYIDWHYRLSWFVPPNSPYYKKCRSNVLFHSLYALRRYLKSLSTHSRKQAFKKFTTVRLHLTRKYSSFEELKKHVPQADVYIVGSDQVWNSLTLYNGKDPAFYLRFAPDTALRVSYAASFGSAEISAGYETFVKEQLSTLDAISVRETSGLKLIESLGLKASVVCDPVFLLCKDEWVKELKLKKHQDNYLLLYNIGKANKQMIEAARLIAKERKLKIYSIASERIGSVDSHIANAGPYEFINCIYNASYVVSNSFHGTALSLIFKCPFLSYGYQNISSRILDLLVSVSLEERYNTPNIEEIVNKEIDYEKVKMNLSKWSEQSKHWLNSQIHKIIQ